MLSHADAFMCGEVCRNGTASLLLHLAVQSCEIGHSAASVAIWVVDLLPMDSTLSFHFTNRGKNLMAQN